MAVNPKSLTHAVVRKGHVVSPACLMFHTCVPLVRWSLGVTLWQMVAGSLPDWAEAQTHHNHNHTAQQQQQESPAGHTTEEALMLPLEPATACHTTPQDLQFPDTFSQVRTAQHLSCTLCGVCDTLSLSSCLVEILCGQVYVAVHTSRLACVIACLWHVISLCL
jgi:hypothetical protein